MATKKCGDLLEELATKPANLEFIKCERVEEGQTIFKAEYRVPGKDAALVEDFLIEKYGMAQLQKSCCILDTMEAGAFKKSDRNGSIAYSVSMGTDEIVEFSGSLDDRDLWGEIPFFYVFATITEI